MPLKGFCHSHHWANFIPARTHNHVRECVQNFFLPNDQSPYICRIKKRLDKD